MNSIFREAGILRLKRIAGRFWERSPLTWAGIALLGFALGKQITSPNRRVLEGFAGLLVVILAFRFQLSVGLSILVFLLPFPTGMSFGSTNTAFVALLFIIWVARISVGQEKPVGRTALDIPIILLLMAYMTSFLNARGYPELMAGMVNFGTLIGSVFLFYLIVNFVKDERALERIVTVASISCLMVLLIALFELLNPGKVLLSGWILGAEKSDLLYMQKGVRVGGPFNDFELLGEYSAINIPLQIFMAVRARTVSRRIAWIILAVMTIVVLHATITRGAFIAFWSGMAYLMTIARRDFDFKRIVGIVVLGVVMFFSVNVILKTYTKSGSVLDRFSTEKAMTGMVPSNRVQTWTETWERSKQHLIIGHSPYYSLRSGVRKFSFPHNTFLFQLYITGIFGLSAFVFFLVKLFIETLRYSARSMTGPSFAKALLLIMNVQLLIFMIDQTKVDHQRNFTYVYYVWYLFGLIVACSRIAKRPEPEIGGALRTAG